MYIMSSRLAFRSSSLTFRDLIWEVEIAPDDLLVRLIVVLGLNKNHC